MVKVFRRRARISKQIVPSANVSQSTVHDYLARAHTAGLDWPLGEEWDEPRLEAELFPPGQLAVRPPKQPLRISPRCAASGNSIGN